MHEPEFFVSPSPLSLFPSLSLHLSLLAVQSLNSLNDQIVHFMMTRPGTLSREGEAFMPGERDTLKKSMALMRHLLMDAQVLTRSLILV